MKWFFFLLFMSVVSHAQVTRSPFIPENGNYEFDLSHINQDFARHHMTYLEPRLKWAQHYRLLPERNEYQVKDWFSHDWFKMQDMYALNFDGYLASQNARTFNEAKRKEYAGFRFDFKHNLHLKTKPAMHEWGGLTHPPFKKLTRPLHQYHDQYGPLNYRTLQSPYFAPALHKELDQVSHSELSFGNFLKAVPDHAAYVTKASLIRKAQRTIFMSSLVFVCDETTRPIVNLLIQKHRAGVEVRVISDGMIATLMGDHECPRLLRDAGIEVIETNDFFSYKRNAIYHTKVLVVDGWEAVAGGQNMIKADNSSRSTDFQNRDLDLYVQGPMARDIQKSFLENWEHHRALKAEARLSSVDDHLREIHEVMARERSTGVRGAAHYASVLGNPATRMKGVCRFIKQAPYENGSAIGEAYLRLLNHVSRYLVITDPVKTDTHYQSIHDVPFLERLDTFTMFNRLHDKVQALAHAGKRIDYVTTNIDMAGNEFVAIMNDDIREKLKQSRLLFADFDLAKIGFMNSYFGKPHYENLIRDYLPHKSVNVWTNISFLHSKVFYFDRIVASVGSMNFHHNATDHAYESTSICMDETLNRELDEILVQDMANSIPLVFAR